MCAAVCNGIALRCGDGGRCAVADASSYAVTDAVTNIFADWHSHAIANVVADSVADTVVRREGDGSGARGLHAEWWVCFACGLQLQCVCCVGL